MAVIGMLLENEYMVDIRVMKEAESLVAGGHGVVVVVPWTLGKDREEIVNGVQIVRIGKHFSHRRKGFSDVFSAVFFVNYLFLSDMKRIIARFNIEHLHIHDLPLAKTGLKLKKFIKGKIVLDLHENYPELLTGWEMTKKSIPIRIKNKLLFGYKRWKRFEEEILPKMDKLIVVVDEMKNKFHEVYSIPNESFLVINNYEKKEFAQKSNESLQESFDFEKDTFYLIYVGGIGPMRGLDTVILGVDKLIKKGRKVKFIVIGSGNEILIKNLKSLSNDLGIGDSILFLGRKPFSVVNFYMQKANLNVIPHIKNGHTDFTIPHKLFQIFLSKRPILVSSCIPLKRFIETCDGGWIFESSNENDFSDKVVEVMESKEELILKKTNNAYQRAMEEWNWEMEGDKLVKFYNEL